VLFQKFLNNRPQKSMTLIKSRNIRIRLKSFDSSLLNNLCDKILEVTRIKNSNPTYIFGPIPMPKQIRRYCVLTSPHVNKDAREHFEIRTHKKIIDVHNLTETTLKDLKLLEIAAGVEVEVVNLLN